MKLKNLVSFIIIFSSLFSITACKSAVSIEPTPLPSIETTTVSNYNETITETPANNMGAEPKKIPLIFSHDGAMDDIAALLYLSKNPNVEIIGVINSYGEQVPSKSAQKWVAYLHEVLDLDTVPFAIGSDTPLDPAGYAFPESWRVAANDFWGLELPPSTASIDKRVGYQLIIDLVNSSPEKVTLLVIGAQTDVALALQHDPEIKNNIEKIVIMGGAFHTAGNLNGPNGNAGDATNDVAEWNIFVDALAAKQVFLSGIPLTIIPLDGSEDFWMTKNIANQMSSSKDKKTQFFYQLCEKEFEIWGGDFLMWDTLAAVALTDPQYFSWENGNLDVITEVGDHHGQTIVVDGDNKNNVFAVDNNYEALLTHILDIILGR